MNFWGERGHNSAYNRPQLTILPYFLEMRNGGPESFGAAWFIGGDLGMDPSFLPPLQVWAPLESSCEKGRVCLKWAWSWCHCVGGELALR